MNTSIMLVGCGNMGRAMLGGWLDEGVKPNDVVVIDPSSDNQEKAAKMGCRAFSSPLVVEDNYQPDVIILAVKPQVISDVISSYKKYTDAGALVISIAAGARIHLFEESFGAETAIIRTMPNTPAAIRKGMMVSVGNANVTEQHRKICDMLMQAIGTTAWVDDEALMDAVTGLSGSGPAYVFYMIEAMRNAGVAAGLPEELALLLAKTTVAGAGELAQSSTDEVEQLRINVTSPNGTTAAGLSVLMADDGLTPLMSATVAAATKRSEELG